MEQTTLNSERLTALVSTLVAVAILAAGVTAQQSRSARPDELTFLESDLRFQLDSAFRQTPKEGESRLKQLESVLASWRSEPRTEADRRLLATWMLEATIRSMPGSLEQLPPAPQFGAQEPTDELSTSPLTQTEPLTTEPQESGKNFDIAEEPVAPIVVGLTPGLATPVGHTPMSPAPDLASPSVEHTLISVATHEPRAVPEPASPAVTINLTELTARIAGYHQGLSELESALLADERPESDRLAGQIQLLDSLAKDFQFAQLYCDALSTEERHAIEPPRSLGPALATLRQQLDRLQSDMDGDFLGEYDSALSKELAELRSQLDSIAGRADW